MSKQQAGILAIVAFLPGALWSLFVVCRLWGWFVVPQFGVAPLAMRNAIGLSLLLGLLFPQPRSPELGTDKERLEAVCYLFGRLFFAPLVALCIGALLARF